MSTTSEQKQDATSKVKAQDTALLSTSATLLGACRLVRGYFFNEALTLVETPKHGIWSIHRSNGLAINGCQVRLHKGRYRFEQLEAIK